MIPAGAEESNWTRGHTFPLLVSHFSGSVQTVEWATNDREKQICVCIVFCVLPTWLSVQCQAEPLQIFFNTLKTAVISIRHQALMLESSPAWQIFWMRANHLYTSKLLYKPNSWYWKVLKCVITDKFRVHKPIFGKIFLWSLSSYDPPHSILCFYEIADSATQTEWLSRGKPWWYVCMCVCVHPCVRESITEG